jgi:hypothetical protein
MKMYAAQWHFDVPFGKQQEALTIMKDYEKALRSSPNYPKDRGMKLMVGHIGLSASRVIVENLFDALGDFEKMLTEVGTGKYRQYAEKLAPLISPGSQHWIILRIAE